jgi:pheromone shutdown protein TraB
MGEKRTRVNHVGLVVRDGEESSVVVVEALSKVKRHRLRDQYGPPRTDAVAVYRAANLTSEEARTVVATAERQVGKKYGYLKIAAHFLDWLLLGVYAFRRLVPEGKYPICSWLVAYSFSKVGKHFGVDPGAATPDDIWDFIEGNPDRYVEMRPLRPLDRE